MEERWILVPVNDNCKYVIYQHLEDGTYAFNVVDKGDTLDSDDYPVRFKTEAEADEFIQSNYLNTLRSCGVELKSQVMFLDPAYEKDGGQPWKQD